MATWQPWLAWRLELMLLTFLRSLLTFMSYRSVLYMRMKGGRVMTSINEEWMCLSADMFVDQCGSPGGEDEDHCEERTDSEVCGNKW